MPQQGNPYLPPGPDPYPINQFLGINTATSRPGVDDKMLWWCDGFFPLEPFNLRTLYGVGPALYVTTGASIVFYKFGNIGSTPICVVFLADGSIWQVNTTTLGVTQIAAANTIQNPSQTTVGMSQWGSQYIVIVSKQTNGFFIWDGTLFYQAGTLAPGVTLTAGGSNYTSAPTVTASGGNGSGATFTATISPTGSVVGVTINTPNNVYSTGLPSPITLTVSGGGGGGASLTPNFTFVGFASGGATLYRISSVTIVNGGAGYTSAPAITLNLNGATAVTGTTFTATVATVSPVINVTMTNPGNGYLATDTVTLNFSGGGGTGASATVNLMPFGLAGNAVETYSGRVWIANANNVFFTAPGSVYNIATSAGGGQFTSSDSFLRVQYNALRQTNGFLYLFGDSSVNYISGVQTSGSPPTTTFTNQNADPEVGSPWPNTVDVWGQNIVLANTWGAHISYGSRVTKISEPLDGFYNSTPLTAIIPSAAKANIFGKKAWMLLLPVIDLLTGQQVNKLCMWDGKKWWTSQQDHALIYIATQEINSVLTAYGSDGTTIWPLFQQPSVNFVKALQSKLWGDLRFLTAAARIWMLLQYYSQLSSTLTVGVDNEAGTSTQSVSVAPSSIPVVNALGTIIPTVNALLVQIPVFSMNPAVLSVLQPTAVGQTGVLLGLTVKTSAADVSLLSLLLQPEIVGYRG